MCCCPDSRGFSGSGRTQAPTLRVAERELRARVCDVRLDEQKLVLLEAYGLSDRPSQEHTVPGVSAVRKLPLLNRPQMTMQLSTEPGNEHLVFGVLFGTDKRPPPILAARGETGG